MTLFPAPASTRRGPDGDSSQPEGVQSPSDPDVVHFPGFSSCPDSTHRGAPQGTRLVWMRRVHGTGNARWYGHVH
jgi:hypothetical protein